VIELVKGVASNAWGAHASRVWAMASSPSRTFLYAIFVRHDIVLEDRFGETPKPARETRALPRPAKLHAFTVVELLIVMAIILILAGLILATSSYVQKKGARSRAEAEIAAMSAALENYKADNGIYPRGNADGGTTSPSNTDSLDARANADPATYQLASLFLYKQLSGDSNADLQPPAGAKSYFSFKPQMLSGGRDANGNLTSVLFIRDPFGTSYGYSTAYQYAPTTGYNPTFDLWSTANADPPTDRSQWVKNW
jgi:prepilin-type N-terminal cleavage/methylation domain-containing protein